MHPDFNVTTVIWREADHIDGMKDVQIAEQDEHVDEERDWHVHDRLIGQATLQWNVCIVLDC